jgi:acyl-CoA reductase-like NAD-dependent aldehyde dehydrogenase
MGAAISPIKLRPSEVLMVIGVRIAGRTVLGRINSGTKAVYSYLMSTTAIFAKHDPTSGEVIAQYKDFIPDEVFATVASAKEASVKWQALGFSGRKKVLRDIRVNRIRNRKAC